MSIPAFPLAWPVGQKRTRLRRDGAFKVTFARARDDLISGLVLLGARESEIVLSSNVELRRDGLPYADYREPADPGVAVYFDRFVRNEHGSDVRRSFVVACDTFSKVIWNMRAVGLTIEAMRSIQRYGASSLLEQAFQGFAALPPAGHIKPWWEILGVDKNATVDVVRAAYTELARIHHPDVEGGNHERMIEINQAFEIWRDAT